MKLKVIGWTSYDDNTYEAVEATNAIYNAVLDEVVKNDYLFSGYHHQEYDYCCPVLNTGKRVLFSQRGFGGLMAEAHGYNGIYDYSLFAYPVDMDPKHFRLPTQDVDESQIVSEKELFETFQIEVDKETYAIADIEEILVLRDYKDYRYLEVGDVIELLHKDGNMKYNVKSIEEKKDVSVIDEYNFKYRNCNIFSEEEKKEIIKKYEEAKTKLVIKLAYKFFF